MQALPGTPYDGHTLSGQITQIERLTGIAVERAYVDRGYSGHKHAGPAKVYIAHSRGIASPTIRRELRRRNAVRSEEHTSELKSIMRSSYAVLCLNKKKN